MHAPLSVASLPAGPASWTLLFLPRACQPALPAGRSFVCCQAQLKQYRKDSTQSQNGNIRASLAHDGKALLHARVGKHSMSKMLGTFLQELRLFLGVQDDAEIVPGCSEQLEHFHRSSDHPWVFRTMPRPPLCPAGGAWVMQVLHALQTRSSCPTWVRRGLRAAAVRPLQVEHIVLGLLLLRCPPSGLQGHTQRVPCLSHPDPSQNRGSDA